MVHGLSLAAVTRRWLGETPFVQVSMTRALTCPEMVHQRPCMMREIETWLSDSRVSNSSVVDHRSQRPVLSPLRNCVSWCHVWPYLASRCKPWRWMLKDIGILRPIWMAFSDLKHTCIVSCHFTTYRRKCNIAEHWQPWELRGLQAAWNQVHWTMEFGVDETCVAGSSPHWTAVFCDWVA